MPLCVFGYQEREISRDSLSITRIHNLYIVWMIVELSTPSDTDRTSSSVHRTGMLDDSP